MFPIDEIGRGARNAYLQAVADVVATGGSERSVAKLAHAWAVKQLRRSVGSFMAICKLIAKKRCAPHWQALPADDGWALAVRCFVALTEDNKPAAATYYEQMKSAFGVPQDYLPELQRAFDEASSELVTIDFSQMPDGPQIPGWLTDLAGTGIEAAIANRALILSGVQATGDRLATVFTVRDSGPVRRITMLGDASQMGQLPQSV